MTDSVKKLKQKVSWLASRRKLSENRWQDILEYFMPNESDFTRQRSPGSNRTRELYDSTGPHAMELAASTLFAQAMNPETDWFGFSVDDPELMKDDEVLKYIEEVQKRVKTVIAEQLTPHNILNLRHLLTFGFSNLFIEEDPDNIVAGQVFPLKDVYFEVDGFGKVTGIHRKFEMVDEQAVGFFDKDGDTLRLPKSSNKKGAHAKARCYYHTVRRRNVAEGGRKGKDKPYESLWWADDQDSLIREGGFDEFPYITPNLDMVAGEFYGRGIGDTALAEVRTANKFQELTIDAGNLGLKPALDVPLEAYVTPLRMTPGALNYNQDEAGRRATPINTKGADVSIGFQTLESSRAAIRQMFFNDQLQLIGGPQMTATEVRERTLRTMLLMAPWHGRLQSQYQSPMILRVYGIMQRNGHLPELPDVLDGVDFKIRYESPLARAQKQADKLAIDEAFQLAAGLEQQGFQGISDNLKPDEMFRRRVLLAGLSMNDLEETQEVTNIRQQRAQAAIAAAQAQQAQQLAAAGGAVAGLPGGEQAIEGAF